jgi:hypothetical protein
MTIIAQVADTLPQQIGSLGAAGFMGVMWLWERRNSQKREQQLDEAHARIVADGLQLTLLTDLVKQNTAAMTRLGAMLEKNDRAD